VSAAKGEYSRFMEKEIYEQARSVTDTIRGRADFEAGGVRLENEIPLTSEQARALEKLIIVACGTSAYAALVGKFMIEKLARLPVEVDYGSEFRYRDPIVNGETAVLAITQSGETVDTLAAMEEARRKGARLWSIVNVIGSQAHRVVDGAILMHAGPEIGVASTKAFTAQVAVLSMLAIELGRRRHVSSDQAADYIDQLAQIPDKIEQILQQSNHIRDIASANVDKENWLFLGRGFNYPVALEGALKLKEISYIHAEGLPAAEMKHGPIALIADGMPAVFIATAGPQYDKIMGNIEEVRARGGKVIVVATEGDQRIERLADHLITIPDAPELFQPMLTSVPLQLLAYHAAVLRGHDVDKPRNLAKSVTVE
jgi:glucosamine--fructose-6-phosphate aminotransferase (isomerizing)